jgi:hypothetical protein
MVVMELTGGIEYTHMIIRTLVHFRFVLSARFQAMTMAARQYGFDPYRIWLGIPADRRPPTYYDILGIEPGESDEEVIRSAAEQRRTFVQSKRGGDHDEAIAKILHQINEGVATLLVPQIKFEYDRRIGIIGKRRQGKPTHPVPSWFDWLPVRIYGEGSGIVSAVAGIMLVICLCLGSMLWLTSRFPGGKLRNDSSQDTAQEKLSLADNSRLTMPSIQTEPPKIDPAASTSPAATEKESSSLGVNDLSTASVATNSDSSPIVSAVITEAKQDSESGLSANQGAMVSETPRYPEGEFLVRWRESTGNSGEIEYEFRKDLSVWKAGRLMGELRSTDSGVIVDYAEASRGQVALSEFSADSFIGKQTWADGRVSTWEATRKGL